MAHNSMYGIIHEGCHTIKGRGLMIIGTQVHKAEGDSIKGLILRRINAYCGAAAVHEGAAVDELDTAAAAVHEMNYILACVLRLVSCGSKISGPAAAKYPW